MREDQEPTTDDLDAIEVEMPLIEAEMALLYAEILLMFAEPEPTALDWHRMRRAEALVTHERVKLRTRTAPTAAQAA